MLRKCVWAALVLVLAAGVGLAAQKEKKGQTAAGTIKNVDAAAGTLTVSVKVKKEATDKDFTIGDATKVVVFDGNKKKELTGKDGLKDELVKEGVAVAVVSDADGKVTELRVGNPPKPVTAAGTLKKVEAAAGTLTVSVKVKKELTDKEFKVEDATKVIIFDGDERKQLAGKDGLKDGLVKEGVAVAVVSSPEGKVTEVRVGTPPKPPATGTLKKVDAAAGTLTVSIKSKMETIDKDFTITDATKVIVFSGEDKKELAGKDGLKNDQFKEGVAVAVSSSPDGKVTRVQIGTPPKKKKEPK